jgi:hypothetical protein
MRKSITATDLIAGNCDENAVVFACHLKLAANGKKVGSICRHLYIKPVRKVAVNLFKNVNKVASVGNKPYRMIVCDGNFVARNVNVVVWLNSCGHNMRYNTQNGL